MRGLAESRQRRLGGLLGRGQRLEDLWHVADDGMEHGLGVLETEEEEEEDRLNRGTKNRIGESQNELKWKFLKSQIF